MPNVNCIICSSVFYCKPSHSARGWGKYCSKECQYKGMKTGQLFSCYHCKKQTYRTVRDQSNTKSGKFFCNKSCQTIWRNSTLYVGANHANWNGGGASYRSRLLKATLHQACTKCKTMDKRILAVHHKDRNRKNNELSNLIWLCHNCHFLVHHYQEESVGFLVPVA